MRRRDLALLTESMASDLTKTIVENIFGVKDCGVYDAEDVRKFLQSTFLNEEWLEHVKVTTIPFTFEEQRHLFITDEQATGDNLWTDIPNALQIWDNYIGLLMANIREYCSLVDTCMVDLQTADSTNSELYLSKSLEKLNAKAKAIDELSDFANYKRDEVEVGIRPFKAEELRDLAEILLFNIDSFEPRCKNVMESIKGVEDESVYDTIQAKLRSSDTTQLKKLTLQQNIGERFLFGYATEDALDKYLRAYVSLLLAHIE